jgi:hypothetical protein
MGMIKSKLKRRLRKKFHLGEFQEFGFEILMDFRKEITETEFDKFYDKFIEEIENHNFQFGGGGDSKTVHGFVTYEKRFSLPNTDEKEKIRIWVENRFEVEDCRVGDFIDAWNNPKWNN